VLAVLVLLITGYLLVLTLSATFLRGRLSQPRPAAAERRLAVLIPAYNEELLIGRLLRNLHQQDYPPERYDVCVVADNCTDRTAVVARSLGARVFERFDATNRAKGYALRWLLDQLQAEGRARYDAFVILDADSIVSANFLRAMDARLAAGSQVVQAYYSVLNAQQSILTGLRAAALAAVHYLRPLGRAAFGLSCGLKGNGMCFQAAILERFAWRWHTLAEDVEFHLALVRAGVRVDFAPEALVSADMPLTLSQATSQNQRWERGRLQLVRQHVPPLLLDGLRQRSLLRLDAAVEQLIPPQSVPFAVAGLCLIAGLALGDQLVVVLASLGLAGQAAYLLTALALARAPRRAYVALAAAPIYIVWKLGLYAQAVMSTRASAWVRTSRVPTAPAQ
jgi:cellulose synthase/poly-beta-1,6-N-acetylglucosamine synthase-like glycosyltransferase